LILIFLLMIMLKLKIASMYYVDVAPRNSQRIFNLNQFLVPPYRPMVRKYMPIIQVFRVPLSVHRRVLGASLQARNRHLFVILYRIRELSLVCARADTISQIDVDCELVDLPRGLADERIAERERLG
jgi:hypothetical protein